VRIKVDEDLPVEVAVLLRSQGYEAETVREEGLGGFKDGPLWAAVQTESRFLVTADKGFADIRSHSPGTHAGVLLLRPDEDGIRPVVELMEDVLEETDLSSLAQAIAVATPRGLRVRWPPRG